MSDESVREEAPDNSIWNNPDQEVEVVIDEETPEDVPEEFKDKSKTDIIKQLKELEEKQNETNKMSDALAQLAKANSEQRIVVQPPAPVPQAPPKAPTMDELREQYGEKFTMDPVGTVMELQQQKMSPAIQQMATGNLQLARRVMELDPEKGPTFKKYSNEIDQMVAGAPPEVRTNPMIYEEAYRRVVNNHMEDILNERVSKAVEAKLAELKVVPASGEKPPATFTEGKGLAQPAKRVTVRISQAQLDRLKTLGIDPKDYAGVIGGGK